MIVTLLAASAAAQHASEPQPVGFEDEALVFNGVAVDTGWWPDAAAPISVRFSIVPTGGVVTEIAGESVLEWPEDGTGVEPLLHHVDGFVGGGWFGVDADLDITTEVQLNLLGVFTGIVPLGARQIHIEQGEAFDGLLLPESAVPSMSVSSTGTPLPLSYAVEVIPTVDLTLGVNLFPELNADLQGVEVRTESMGIETAQVAEEHWVPLAPDPSRPAEVGMATTWVGQLDAALDLVIEPEVVVSTLLGPFTLARFPIPVSLGSGSETRELGPAFYSHPLPVIGVDAEPLAFGPVDEGAMVTVELPIENLGELQLVGTVEVLGDDGFRVFPTDLTAPPQAGDGLVVTFQPTQLGDAEGLLVLHTNDPVVPVVQIELSATGVISAAERELQRINGEDARGSGCGCVGGGSAPGGLAVLGLLAARRR